MLLRKSNSNTIKVLISKTFADSYISHDKFVPVNEVLKEHDETKIGNKKSWKSCGIYYINMVDKSRKTYEGNGVETMVDIYGVMWLNEKVKIIKIYKWLQ